MARNIRALFGSDFTFSESSGTSNINGTKIVNDYPPSAQNVASIFIHSDGASVTSIEMGIYCQFWSGVDWGPLHAVIDENGAAITIDPSEDEDRDADLYGQPWWKENDGWRIVLTRANPTTFAGQATAIIR